MQNLHNIFFKKAVWKISKNPLEHLRIASKFFCLRASPLLIKWGWLNTVETFDSKHCEKPKQFPAHKEAESK